MPIDDTGLTRIRNLVGRASQDISEILGELTLLHNNFVIKVADEFILNLTAGQRTAIRDRLTNLAADMQDIHDRLVAALV